MPEYLAPGVYIEETSFRSKAIEGVSTTTTGFVGPVRYGPVQMVPDIVTSLSEFQRTYGDGDRLTFVDQGRMDNYVWHGVRAFFEQDGKRLYVSRTFKTLDYSVDGNVHNDYRQPSAFLADDWASTGPGAGTLDGPHTDGHARRWLWPTDTAASPLAATTAPPDGTLLIRARHPGSYGNFRVQLTLSAGANLLGGVPDPQNAGQFLPRFNAGDLSEGDVLLIPRGTLSSPVSPLSPAAPLELSLGASLFLADWDAVGQRWQFRPISGGPTLQVSQLNGDPAPGRGDTVRLLSLSVGILGSDGSARGVWSGLSINPGRIQNGVPSSAFSLLGPHPDSEDDARNLPIELLCQGASVAGILSALQSDAGEFAGLDLQLSAQEQQDGLRPDERLARGVSATVMLLGGNDGNRPGAAEYEGQDDPTTHFKTGLKMFEDIEDISIVAAPGHTWNYANFRSDANTIMGLLMSHAERMRYRIAVLDSAQGQSISEIRKLRAKIDSKYAALYYPWVRVLDPITRREITLPPSGFVAGIYARNDVNRAVYKAPANEVVTLALGFELSINKAQQEVLNPEGINCFRFFEGRGLLLWGARTISSDPEWKYVNLRRYFAYLERSIDKGTQWAVFEPNSPPLWTNVRYTISDFLMNEWSMGALLGNKPEQAFFVRCDRSTMTQNDIDNGRLVCLIGVAVVRPAEFVVFRIGQFIGDRKGG